MKLTITLPLPNASLSPNSRKHWRVKAKFTKLYRLLANIEAINSMLRANMHHAEWTFKWQSATVRCHFYHRDSRRRDADNLLASMKAAFDGLADAGLVTNDSGFTHLPVLVAKDGKNPRVEITIEETRE